MRKAHVRITLACLLLAGIGLASDTAWVRRYNGVGNDYDAATAMAVDANGNVYVTGYSPGTGTGDDYATVKYSSAGIQQWAARHNGPGNGNDEATAIAVDADGNVYVTGASAVVGTNRDYATIKYNSTGVEQWVARYNGPGNGADYATAIAVDGSGNVYVTGSILGSGTGNDYATVKYNSAGEQQWVLRYNGPGNGNDVCRAIAVDGSDNVYVTGHSPGLGTLDDYATIKYSSAGEELWVVRYNGPGNGTDAPDAIALDAAGNVYVTGRSVDVGTDYTTIRYNSAGEEQWVARYNGPGNDYDQAHAVAVDGSGNVYVTGWSRGSGTSNDYATIKYNSAGVEQWVARYNGPGNDLDWARDIAVDGSGNVYVTGWSVGSGTGYDYATVKYDPAGTQKWVARYEGPVRPPGNTDDYAQAIAVDANGKVYVTGCSMGWGTEDDYATVKYTQAPEPFHLSSPTNHAPAEPIEGDLTWVASSDADYYTVFLSTNNPPDSLIDVTGTSCHYGPLLNGQKYYWTVYAKNAYGRVQTSSGIRDFTTIVAAPEPPVLAWPPNGAPNQPVAGILAWNPAPRATWYDVYLDVVDPPLALVSSNQSGASYTYSGLSNEQTYYWKVVARNVNGTAGSDIWEFTTVVTAPEAPVLVSPENGAIDQMASGTLTWNPALRATGYDVYLDIVNPPVNMVSSSQPGTSYDYSGLTADQTYYWKIAARNVGGTADSDVWEFTTVLWLEGWTEARPAPNTPTGKPVKDGGWLATGPDNETDGLAVYAAKGNKATDFYRYHPVEDSWVSCAPIPDLEGTKTKPPSKGCVGVSDGEGHLYMTKGNNTLGFWRYDVEGDSWHALPEVPLGEQNKKVKGGTDMVYVPGQGDIGWVYLLKGYKTEFYRFNTATETWDSPLPEAPAGGGKQKYDKGSFLVYDPAGYIYAHQAKYYDQASGHHYMFRYDLGSGGWTDTLKGMPLAGWHGGRPGKNKKSKDGAAGDWYAGSVYALKGGNTQQFYQYFPEDDSWQELDTVPSCGSTERRKYVKQGADLAGFGNGVFFALKGNKTNELWRYVVPTKACGSRPTADSRSGVMVGTVEVRAAPGAVPTSKFELLPNPIASGFATVRFSLPKAGPVAVTVFDIAGRAVLRQSAICNLQSAITLDLQKIPAGVYLVRLDADGCAATQKFVVQR